MKENVEESEFTNVQYEYDGDKMLAYGTEACEYDDIGNPKKYRGKIESCIAQYVRDRLGGRDDIRRSRIFITHSGCSPEIVRTVRGIVEECGGFEEVLETTAGCTISNHCGPNTLGVLFIRK